MDNSKAVVVTWNLREDIHFHATNATLLNYKKSECGCVGHGRGFYVNTSALTANIFFGIWEWNESNEMDTWLLFSI